MVENKLLQKKWYDKYLPFVARSPKMQLEWLQAAFKRKTLSFQEITPYIKLFLTDEKDEKRELLFFLLSQLPEKDLDTLVRATDIYDLPKLMSLLHKPTINQAMLALKTLPPPYEKNIQPLLNKIFRVLHEYSEEFFQQACETLLQNGEAPDYFEKEYVRFKEIIEDEKILSALYPKARSGQ